jgi:hypothetical protein
MQPDEFRERAYGEAATKELINGSRFASDTLWLNSLARCESSRNARAQRIFDSRALLYGIVHMRIIFALSSLY